MRKILLDIIKIPEWVSKGIFSFIFLTLIFSIKDIYSQPNSPKFNAFPTVTLSNVSSLQQGSFSVLSTNPILRNSSTDAQNIKLMQQGGMTLPGTSNTKEKSIYELNQDKAEEVVKTKYYIRSLKSTSFQNNFRQFLQLNPDSFSISKAVYLSESAYYDNNSAPSFEQFENALKQRALLVKQILKREGLNPQNSVAANYAIQKLYSQSNEYYDEKTKKSYLIRKMSYDFNDFMGEKDWTNMFVTKLLGSGSGQCHSLPLNYLCIAEQLQAKAYLSLAPNHSFIQYLDDKGRRYNFETTNGNLVSQDWLMQSTFVNATAIKNRSYLDTLSSRKLYAQCLSDMLLNYIMKLGYDEFTNQITRKVLKTDSTNISALMLDANLYSFIFNEKRKEAGNPPLEKYIDYPELNSAYQAKQKAIQKVQQTGFQEMPEKAYQKWLQALNHEKQKQQSKIEQEKMQREIKKIKNRKSTFINNVKN